MRKEQFVSERRERDFTGVFIPSKLYLTNKFSPREKFLLVEIHSLRKRDKSGDCFASNRHFADFIGVSERTIQSMLNGLKQNGYITSWYEYEKDNPKVIKHRHLILTEKFYEEFINEHEQKDQPERGEKKRMGDGEEKCTFRGEENCVDKYNSKISITNIDKKTEPDFIDNKEKKTLSYTDKDNQTSTGKISENTYIAGIVNYYKNYFGKSRVVVIKSQLGQPIAAYSGDEVFWKIPDDLPKMTKLMIDGKALYIHRANFQIIDKELLR